jgi:hypothetical protein
MKRLTLLVSTILLSTMFVSPAASASVLPDWQTTRSSWTNPGARQPKVIDLRFAAHQNFDRVVIEIRGRIPGGTATYHRRFHYDGSGLPVPIRGGLQVALSPAYAHNSAGENVYEGPKLARPGFATLKAVAMTGDFEGYVTFAFGLTPRRSPYRVFWLHNPQRLVIDFKHSTS